MTAEYPATYLPCNAGKHMLPPGSDECSQCDDFDPAETIALLCNLPPNIDAVCRTSDGHYLGHVRGDIGYNAFFGMPSKPHPGPGCDQMLTTWGNLTPDEQAAVIAEAAHPSDGTPIRLVEDFGVPVIVPSYPIGPCERCGIEATGIIRHDCSGMSDERATALRQINLELNNEEREIS